MYSLCFNKAVEFTLAKEGGTNHHVLDRGGLTKYGISSKQYPNLDIANLTFENAVSIYHNDYWLMNGCSHFEDPLAIVMFDTGVNCGIQSAAYWLQGTVSECGAHVTLDGIIGPETITAVTGYSPRTMLEGVVARRLNRYTTLIQNHPEQMAFIRGWVIRVSDLLRYVRSDHASQISERVK